jgi:DNA polymerase III subunit beta
VKLSLSASELLTQLQTVTRVASARSAVQALSGVMISAPADSPPELLATDMEIGLRVPLQAEMTHPGAAVLPARLLLDVARSLPAQELTLELRSAEQDVELICGPATFHLRMLRAEDFPTLPSPTPETRITLPCEAFVQTVSRVARSASRDETRPVLTGILMSASGQELRMVATDSYRLSVKETALQAPLTGSLEANVPARALGELVRIAQQAGSESLAVSVGQNQVVFELGDVVLSSRLIDGQFPNYRQLLPESVDHELRLSTAELGEVVRRISLLAQKNAPLRLSFSEGTLTVSAQTPDVGGASEAIPVPFHGESFDIGFNPEFLRDGLESIETEELVLKLISPLRPGLIESPDSGDFVYLIMPIRLNV